MSLIVKLGITYQEHMKGKERTICTECSGNIEKYSGIGRFSLVPMHGRYMPID